MAIRYGLMLGLARVLPPWRAPLGRESPGAARRVGQLPRAEARATAIRYGTTIGLARVPRPWRVPLGRVSPGAARRVGQPPRAEARATAIRCGPTLGLARVPRPWRAPLGRDSPAPLAGWVNSRGLKPAPRPSAAALRSVSLASLRPWRAPLGRDSRGVARRVGQPPRAEARATAIRCSPTLGFAWVPRLWRAPLGRDPQASLALCAGFHTLCRFL